MAIFNSYVSLPEAKSALTHPIISTGKPGRTTGQISNRISGAAAVAFHQDQGNEPEPADSGLHREGYFSVSSTLW